MNDQKTDEDAVSDTQSIHPRPGSGDLGTSSAIGRRLKAYYDDVASEPVPDRFLSLLDALDAAETKSRGHD